MRFISFLGLGLLAAQSSYAFGKPSFTPQSTLSASTSSALRMSGGQAAPADLKPPPALYEGAVAAGVAKGKGSWAKIFKLGIVSGAHIGFGSYLAISVGGACPGIAAANPGLQKASVTYCASLD